MTAINEAKIKALTAQRTDAVSKRSVVNAEINKLNNKIYMIAQPLNKANNEIIRRDWGVVNKSIQKIDRKYDAKIEVLRKKIRVLRKDCDREQRVAARAIEAKSAKLRRSNTAKRVKLTAPLNAKLLTAQKKSNALYAKMQKLDIDIKREQNIDNFPPVKGKFICYKKVYITSGYYDKPIIAKLEVPKAALRVCFDTTGFKSRVSSAKVLEMWEMENPTIKVTEAWSGYDSAFKYKVGKVVRPRKPFSKKKEICESGIHCYMTEQMANNH